MKNWKEKASELGQWELKGVPMVYPIAFIILLIPILFWNFNNIRYFDEFEIAPDSARYLLSALVQSLAAIIAIVVTLTLVAVQLAASAYSPRVIDIFKKDWVMWLLLVGYGLSIFFGLFVLEMIGGKYQSLGHWGVSLESCIFLAYLMGIAAFAGLFFHIGNVIDLLKPENIIRKLSEDITRENVLKHIKSIKENEKDKTKPIVKDPIQPIVDIIHSAVMKYDIATTGVGLKVVTDRMIEIIDSDGQKDISSHLCDHLGRVGRLTASNRDVDSAIEIVNNLCNFWRSTTANKFEFAASRAVQSLRLFGKDAIDHKFEFAARYTIKHLERVGIDVARNGNAVATKKVVESLGQLGMAAARTKIEIVAQDAVKYLECVGKCAAKNQLKDATVQALDSLGRVGMYAAENELKYVTSEAVRSIRDVGKAAAKNKLEDATVQAVASLGDVGTSAVEKGLEEGAMEAVLSLRKVGQIAAKNELEAATEQTAESIGAVGTAAAEKGFERAALEAVWALRTVGAIAAEKGLEGGTMEAVLSLIKVGGLTAEKGIVVRSLGAVGTIAIEKELKFSIAREAAWFIDGLTISIEEIPDHDSPQKFMNLYKQRLEELREL